MTDVKGWVPTRLRVDTATSGGAISDAICWAERIMEEIDWRSYEAPTAETSVISSDIWGRNFRLKKPSSCWTIVG
jgi:hypothetical protein